MAANKEDAMIGRTTMPAVFGAVIGLIVMVTSVDAVSLSRPTYLTFSGPVGLPGVSLPAGTYIFELANPSTSSDVIVVRDQNRAWVYFLGFTKKVDRPAGLQNGHQVIFEETGAGRVPRISAWYPEGESTGHQFMYRKGR
jgi:hypothetical protein